MRRKFLQMAFIGVVWTLVATSVSQGQLLFFDDFSDGSATDGIPTTWSVGAAGASADREVVGERYVITHDDFASSFVAGQFAYDDVSMRAQLVFTSRGSDTHIPTAGLAVRTPSLAGIFGEIDWDGTLRLGEGDADGNLLTVKETSTLLRPSISDVILQLDANGQDIKLFAWPVGGARPSVAQLQFENPTLQQAAIAVYLDAHGQRASVAFDFIEAAAVPEPPTAVLLLGLPFLGLVLGRHRRPSGQIPLCDHERRMTSR